MPSKAETIRGLLVFLPLLQHPDADFIRIGYWGDMTSRVSGATAKNVYQYLFNNGFVLGDFDWEAWSEQALSFEQNRHTLQNADLPTLYKILTVHMRADRLMEGHFDSIIENGFLADVLERMKDIMAEG